MQTQLKGSLDIKNSNPDIKATVTPNSLSVTISCIVKQEIINKEANLIISNFRSSKNSYPFKQSLSFAYSCLTVTSAWLFINERQIANDSQIQM